MSKNVTISLETPIDGHAGPIRQIVMRPPSWGDVMGRGAPYTIHRDAEGKPFLVYDEVIIAEYANALIIEPRDKLLLESEVGLRDTMAVREAVIDFFLDAAAVGGGSKTSPKNSGSTAGSAPTP